MGGICGGSNYLGTLFGVCAYVNWRQHLFWQQNCVFGKDDFGDLQCLSSIFSQIITFMLFERLLDGISGGSN